MTELGYIEGKNIRYIYAGATTDMSKLPEAAQTLSAAKVDLIISITTPATLAAKQATANQATPVVNATGGPSGRCALTTALAARANTAESFSGGGRVTFCVRGERAGLGAPTAPPASTSTRASGPSS